MTTEIKTIPGKEEIDALAAMYLESQKNADKAQEAADVLRDQLTDMVTEHGYVPKRAHKSRRLEGLKWKCTLSQSDSLETDGTAVQRFHAALKRFDLGRLFRQVFRREQIFVLQPGAQQILDWICERKDARKAATLRLAFSNCLVIKSSRPGLKVEPIEAKEEKEAKAS